MMSQTTRRIRPELHWGYWLIADGEEIRDEEGNTWRSLREAFWDSLQMLDRHSLEVESERLFRVLHSLNRRGTASGMEIELQLAGSRQFRDFYTRWLWSVGLIAGDSMPTGFASSRLSDFGHSVLRMLDLTRNDEFKTLPEEDFASIAEAASRNVSVANERLAEFERQVADWPHQVTRESIGGQHVVKFIYFDPNNARQSQIYMRQVVWSLSFDFRADRDVFFAWLCLQTDHWANWGAIASYRGSRALTETLLRSFAISHLLGEPCWPSGAEGGDA